MPQPTIHHHTAPPIPPWLQKDSFFQSLPEQHQQAIRSIIHPLYERFVLRPTDHVECSIGSSVIYLLWTELITQVEIANTPFDDRLMRRMLMDDLFLILGPKSQLSSLLVRLRHTKPDPEQDESPLPFPLPTATLPVDTGEPQPPVDQHSRSVLADRDFATHPS